MNRSPLARIYARKQPGRGLPHYRNPRLSRSPHVIPAPRVLTLFLLFFLLSLCFFHTPAHAGCGDPESGLVGWWKFDETSGTSAADSSGNSQTATLEGTQTFVPGKINNAIKTAAAVSGSTIAVLSHASIDNLLPATVSSWIKLSSLPATGSSDFADKGTGSTGWVASVMPDGSVQLRVFNGTVILYRQSSAGVITANVWYHVVVTWTSNTVAADAHIYVNGVETAYQTTVDGSGSHTSDASQELDIGGCCGASTELNGLIDDLRIYNRALSATEVKNLYNADYAGQMIFNGDEGVWQYCDGNNWVVVGHPFAPMNGLVGWWKFDDGSGTSVVDSSGNNNTGTLTNSPTWVGGYVGTGALKFSSASAQYAKTAGNFQIASAANFTLSAWIDPLGGYGTVIGQHGNPNGVLVLNAGGGTIDLYYDGWISGTGYPMPPDGQWTHIAAVVSGSNNLLYVNGALVASVNRADYSPDSSDPLYIGYSPDNNSYFNGLIDDVRVYNRALSATEVSDLYLASGGTATGDTTTGLVGWWKLDDGGGTSAADSSGNGLTATLYANSNPNNLTLWPSPTWTSGKIDGALQFSAPSYQFAENPGFDIGSVNFTISAWVSQGSSGAVMGQEQGGGGVSWALRADGDFNSTGSFGWMNSQPPYYGSWPSPPSTPWYLLTVVGTATTTSVYENAVLAASVNTPVFDTGANKPPTNPLYIGFSWNCCGFFNGKMDDVRLYNRALSATDIAALYNERACSSPAGWAGDFRYDADSGKNAMIFCDGKNWQPMGPLLSGAGGGGCTTPAAGSAGDLKYFGDLHAMAYCNGANWIRIGRVPVATSSGLVGWWKMDEGTGSTTADSSGNNNTGTLNGSPTWTTGKDGGALNFSGNNQYVNVPGSASLDVSGSFTLSAWIKPSSLPSPGGENTLIYQYSTWGIRLDNGYDSPPTPPPYWAFQVSTTTAGAPEIFAPANISTGTWYLVTAVWDPSTSKMYWYINGILASTQNIGSDVAQSGAHSFLIGAWPANSGSNSTIDDVRLYNRALTASEIWDLYLATGGT